MHRTHVKRERLRNEFWGSSLCLSRHAKRRAIRLRGERERDGKGGGQCMLKRLWVAGCERTVFEKGGGTTTIKPEMDVN